MTMNKQHLHLHLEPGKLYKALINLGHRSNFSGVLCKGSIVMFLKSEIYYRNRLSGRDRRCRFTFLDKDGNKLVFRRPAGGARQNVWCVRRKFLKNFFIGVGEEREKEGRNLKILYICAWGPNPPFPLCQGPHILSGGGGPPSLTGGPLGGIWRGVNRGSVIYYYTSV